MHGRVPILLGLGKNMDFIDYWYKLNSLDFLYLLQYAKLQGW